MALVLKIIEGVQLMIILTNYRIEVGWLNHMQGGQMTLKRPLNGPRLLQDMPLLWEMTPKVYIRIISYITQQSQIKSLVRMTKMEERLSNGRIGWKIGTMQKGDSFLQQRRSSSDRGGSMKSWKRRLALQSQRIGSRLSVINYFRTHLQVETRSLNSREYQTLDQERI